MRSALAHAAQFRERTAGRSRAVSLSTVPPAESDDEYDPHLAAVAASILYRSPQPSQDGRPVYILNAAAFPDASDLDYDSLLSYVLARLPGEDELLSGMEYEIVFFAGGQPDSPTAEKKQGPGMGWYLQAYHVLSRATRKKLQKLYIVHPRTWVRVLVGVFGTIVSPKFRRKIVHVNTLSALALHVPLEKLLIPPSVYLHDRKLLPDIYVPFATGKRAFGVMQPLPKNLSTGATRLPRVLRETTAFILHPRNIRTEGIFRIPPHATLAGVLKESYDRGQNYIVWKEKGNIVIVYPRVEESLLDEIRLEDAYGVHQAASLIKQWYRDLREPIFPENSYESLNTYYSHTPLSPEDMEQLLSPTSPASPLTELAREILTRHLLPLLATVAAHERENKMSPGNLGVCFAMCLVRGQDQIRDAKMSSVVRGILEAAVDMWTKGLRESISGSDERALWKDVEGGLNGEEYEDPLEVGLPPPNRRVSDGGEEREDELGRKIGTADFDEKEKSTMPWKRASANSPVLPSYSPSKEAPYPPPAPAVAGAPAKKAPTLPPRPPPHVGLGPAVVTSPLIPNPNSASAASPIIPSPNSELKRKPAPPVVDPPRYSSVFDPDGHSLHVADSPVPADGFGPPRRADFSFDVNDSEEEKKGFSVVSPREAGPGVKRKGISGSSTPVSDGESAGRAEAGEMWAERKGLLRQSTPVLAEGVDGGAAATQRRAAATAAAAAGMARSLSATSSASASSTQETLSSTTAPSDTSSDNTFRKPTWPASARPQSLAKPVVPPRHSQTLPVPLPTNGSAAPRPRTPSPGLLQRMSSMELAGQPSASTSSDAPAQGIQRRETLEPSKLNLKKSSVEDLRRLYEERVNTAQGLARAQATRRASAGAGAGGEHWHTRLAR